MLELQNRLKECPEPQRSAWQILTIGPCSWQPPCVCVCVCVSFGVGKSKGKLGPHILPHTQGGYGWIGANEQTSGMEVSTCQ